MGEILGGSGRNTRQNFGSSLCLVNVSIVVDCACSFNCIIVCIIVDFMNRNLLNSVVWMS